MLDRETNARFGLDVHEALKAARNAAARADAAAKGDEGEAGCKFFVMSNYLHCVVTHLESVVGIMREMAEKAGEYPPDGPDLEDVTGDPRHRGVPVPEGLFNEATREEVRENPREG